MSSAISAELLKNDVVYTDTVPDVDRAIPPPNLPQMLSLIELFAIVTDDEPSMNIPPPSYAPQTTFEAILQLVRVTVDAVMRIPAPPVS